MQNLLTDLLSKQLESSLSTKASQALGADKGSTSTAIAKALPLLLDGLAKNTADKKGAQSLDKALSRDHDGGILDQIDSLVSNPEMGHGDGILKHVFGDKLSGVEQYVGEQSGLNADQSGGIMKILAPLVMGGIGKAKKDGNLDMDQITGLISQASKAMNSKEGISSALLVQLLDKDGDGDIKDDLLSMGMNWVKRQFAKR